MRDAGSRDKVPDRIRLAVELVEPQPGEQILEIGCGPGVAAKLVAERLTGPDRAGYPVVGHLVAIDRSATAIDRATARNAQNLDRVTFVRTALAQYVPDREFDKVFCINVNVFWTGPADRELAVITAALKPGGQLFACYEPPADPAGATGDRAADRIVGPVREAFARHGLHTTVIRTPLLCVVCRTTVRS